MNKLRQGTRRVAGRFKLLLLALQQPLKIDVRRQSCELRAEHALGAATIPARPFMRRCC